MSLKCGIVGLPNVGKSMLFNILAKSEIAQSANYPFCTIEPNSAKAPLNNKTIATLAEIANSEKIIPNFLEVVDIAGLVRGASSGEGLGNKFLSHIRDVDAIIHLVRCFFDDDVIHVEHSVDPLRDIETIQTELILADLEQAHKAITKHEKKAKSGDKPSIELHHVCTEASRLLDNEMMLSTCNDTELLSAFNRLNFITCKPMLYVCNVSESDFSSQHSIINPLVQKVEDYAKKANIKCASICIKLETELIDIESDEERLAFLKDLGILQGSIDVVTGIAFEMLRLKTFYTVGKKETRAWAFCAGAKAPECAGIIHTDFERGFIKAEVISLEDYIKYKGEPGAKEAGKLRIEGKEYIVQDGDIMNFKFNV